MLPLCLQEVCESIKWQWEFTDTDVLPLCLQEVCESIKWQWELTNTNMLPLCLQNVCESIKWQWEFTNINMLPLCLQAVCESIKYPLNNNNQSIIHWISLNASLIHFLSRIVNNTTSLDQWFTDSLTAICRFMYYSRSMWSNFIFTYINFFIPSRSPFTVNVGLLIQHTVSPLKIDIIFFKSYMILSINIFTIYFQYTSSTFSRWDSFVGAQ